MTYETSLAVARIIQRHDALDADVLSLRHEVAWPDGSRIGIHPVRQHCADAQFLRALHLDGYWLLFDLRQHAPQLAADLPTAPTRDKPGTVMYALRAAFHNDAGFLASVQAKTLAKWPGSPRAADPRPSRNEALAA
jgi:hypothetical protein